MKYLLIILIFISCSPIKRHSRLVKKFPYVHTVDSIKLIDTVRLNTNSVKIDTVTLLSLLKDTITLIEDNLSVEVYTVRDSFYINAKCDTIYLEKIITRNIPIKYYKENEINYNWLFLILALFIAYYVFLKK
tara:strand:+ start:186 stop:581 length:396 start_codon:yes stop_codon:yes gene_type:complete